MPSTVATSSSGLTNDLIADLTYHTDFAQVEADQEVVNLTRFSLFFPEKRQFFTESAGIFDFGKAVSGLGGEAAADIDLPLSSRAMPEISSRVHSRSPAVKATYWLSR